MTGDASNAFECACLIVFWIKKGSSRLSGESRFYLQEEVISISIAISHSLD